MRFPTLLAALALATLAQGANAQSYYGSDRILQHYDPFDTIPGAEVQGGIGSGLAPSPARPLVLGLDGFAVYAPTNPLLPGPQYVDPRRYGQLRLTPYERRLYFAKDPQAYARRHAYEPPHRLWPGEATNPVVASTGYRPSPDVAERAYRESLRGFVTPSWPVGPDDILYVPRR